MALIGNQLKALRQAKSYRRCIEQASQVNDDIGSDG
jgi:hypothetical protein